MGTVTGSQLLALWLLWRPRQRAVDTFLRCHYEQGLSKRLRTSVAIFVAELLGF